MAKNYYLSGQWNVTCDVCSKKIKSSNAKHRWDGFITCPDCWEPRQPLDFIRARVDKITVPFQRPIPTLQFIPQNFTEPLASRVYTDEEYTRIVSFIRAYTDSVSLLDQGVSVQIDHGRSFTDTVSLTENFDALVYTLLTLTDTASITETVAKSASIPAADSITIVDVEYKLIAQNPTDTVTSADTVVKLVNKIPSDSITLTETLLFTQEANDAINDTALNTQAIN